MPKYEARAVYTVDGGEPTMWSTTIAADNIDDAAQKAETTLLSYVGPDHTRQLHWNIHMHEVAP